MTAASPGQQLQALRERADEDFGSPPQIREAGRHQIDISELGLRVALTRARYPNRPDGIDLYVVTISRLGLRQQPGRDEAMGVVVHLFGPAARSVANERPGGPLIRMYRVPAALAAP